MKNILLYGDSNTWGFNPDFTSKSDLRFAREERWGGVLQECLGPECCVLEEGLSGRTTSLEDPAAPGRSGLALLAPIVQSHQPLDLLVFLLGTNDAWDTRKPPKMLLISPTYIYDRGVHDFIDAASAEKSLHLAAHYEQLSKDYGCAFLDAAQVAAPSEWEGLHLDKKGHTALGRAAAEAVRRLMK